MRKNTAGEIKIKEFDLKLTIEIPIFKLFIKSSAFCHASLKFCSEQNFERYISKLKIYCICILFVPVKTNRIFAGDHSQTRGGNSTGYADTAERGENLPIW